MVTSVVVCQPMITSSSRQLYSSPEMGSKSHTSWVSVIGTGGTSGSVWVSGSCHTSWVSVIGSGGTSGSVWVTGGCHTSTVPVFSHSSTSTHTCGGGCAAAGSASSGTAGSSVSTASTTPAASLALFPLVIAPPVCSQLPRRSPWPVAVSAGHQKRVSSKLGHSTPGHGAAGWGHPFEGLPASRPGVHGRLRVGSIGRVR